MNIGIIGNINNYPFVLGEGLRGCGARVSLVLTRPDILHHPVKAGLEREIPDWVYDASSLGQEAFENQDGSIGEALNFALNDADFVILNDVGPSLCNLISVPILSLLTGSDLSYYANPQSGAMRRESWGQAYLRSPAGLMHSDQWDQLILRQRTGIRHSRVVSHPSRGLLPGGDALLDQIGVGEEQRMFLYFTDTNRVERAPMPGGEVLKILNGARLNWVDPMPTGFTDQDHKGTDRLLRGLRLFLDRGGAAELTLVAKGLHVAETRKLVAKLRLQSHVVWRDEMTAAEFSALIADHHVVCDQFGRSLPGMVGLTAMARGRPVLARFPLETLNSLHGEPWPVCHAETPAAIADHLLALSDPEFRSRLGDDARRFADRYLSPRAAGAACIERLYGQRLWRRELTERELRGETETQRSEIEAQRAELDSQKAELDAQSAELEVRRVEIERQKSEIASNEVEIVSQKDELARLAAGLRKRRREVESLTVERQNLIQQVEDLKLGLDASEEEIRFTRNIKSKSGT
jgi:glycosyltransferase involved in cell wall biosynthesis